MRRLILKDGTTATLRDTGKWASSNKRFAAILNWYTRIEMPEIGPAQGQPLAVIFNRIAKMTKAEKIIDTTPAPSTNEEVVY